MNGYTLQQRAKRFCGPVARSAILLAAAVSLAACGTFSSVQNEPPPTTTEVVPYQIGVGDTVTINVWRNPELSPSVVVRPDGYISMPLMGDLKAEGERPEALARVIDLALREVIRNPEVTVIVNTTASIEYRNRVRLTGEVGAPSSIAHRPGMTVADLVLEAGGVSDFGAGGRAVLQRRVDGEYQRYAVDLDAIINHGNMATNYTVEPGDVISVPRKRLLRGEF